MPNTPLSNQQLMRYSRHIMLPKVDIDGQQRLWQSAVLIIGLGGLGSAAAQYLAASGVGQLTLVDDDQVDLSNLQRQILHTEQSVGNDKVASAANQLSQLNSEITIHTINRRLSDDALAERITTHKVVIDCSDNLATRNQLNKLCHQHSTPLISGAAIRMEGQVSTFTMAEQTPCYHCLSSTFAEQDLSCSEAGILSPVVGIVGAIQATEAIKVIAQFGEPLSGQLLTIDAATMAFRSFKLAKLADCPVCGAK